MRYTKITNDGFGGSRFEEVEVPQATTPYAENVPPLLVSHFVLSVQFDHTKPFAIGSIHTFHDSQIIAPIPVGATVRIHTKAIDKFIRRERKYVRHEVTVTDVTTGKPYFKEIRDILSR